MISIRTRIRPAVILAPMVALFFAAAPSLAQMKPRREMRMRATAADQAAIRQVVEKYGDAFNHHDGQAITALYAPSADLTNMFGVSMHGRPAIEKLYTRLFSSTLKKSHRDIAVKSIRMLGRRLAVMDANWEMSGTTRPNGTPNPVRKGMFTWVMAKRGGQWYILVFHEFDFPGQ